jgi:putative glutathione S-transferase
MIAREFLGLSDAISLSITSPVWGERGWTFRTEPGAIPDSVNGKKDVVELYRAVDPDFKDEETVPILWDKSRHTIVNNESREILRMMDREFLPIRNGSITLCPPGLEAEIDRVIDAIYDPINDGVYRCGFARSQDAYDRAVTQLFVALDHWESVLAHQRYLCGQLITEADVCLYVTLVRFDLVYYTHFKTNVRRITDYPALWGYVRDLYRVPAFRNTTDFDHIKRHYFGSHRDLNPYGIIPAGPLLDFDAPHGRERL